MQVLALVISALAVVVALSNMVWTQARTDQRELHKWQRDAMLRLVGSVLELSTQRNQSLLRLFNDYVGPGASLAAATDTNAPILQMAGLVEQIRLIDEATAEKAAKIHELHDQTSQGDVHPNDIAGLIDDEIVNVGVLKAAHDELIAQFNIYVANQ